jgi:hypothetical protein
MNFSYALDRIKWGQPMSRQAWGDPAIYVYRLNPPDSEQINRRNANGSTEPWAPTIEDIMATDWFDVPRID